MHRTQEGQLGPGALSGNNVNCFNSPENHACFMSRYKRRATLMATSLQSLFIDKTAAEVLVYEQDGGVSIVAVSIASG